MFSAARSGRYIGGVAPAVFFVDRVADLLELILECSRQLQRGGQLVNASIHTGVFKQFGYLFAKNNTGLTANLSRLPRAVNRRRTEAVIGQINGYRKGAGA